MRRVSLQLTLSSIRTASSGLRKPPIIHVDNGTFYRNYPSSKTPDSNPLLFPNLTFSLPSYPSAEQQQQHWAILGPSSSGKTTLLEILRGGHLCIPPTARSFPYLARNARSELRNPSRAIQYVGFGGEHGSRSAGAGGAYLSARYESRREATDFSVLQYLNGDTELNPAEEREKEDNSSSLNRVIEDLRLHNLIAMPMGNLSNGQLRRAKIAKALLSKPEVLLLDEPFLGLDPPTLTTLSPLLHRLAQAQSPRLILALRPQDLLPDWISHLVILEPGLRVRSQGPREKVLTEMGVLGIDGALKETAHSFPSISASKSVSESLSARQSSPPNSSFSVEGLPLVDDDEMISSDVQTDAMTDPLVEMENVKIKYGDKQVLGGWEKDMNGHDGFWWTVRRGERWGVFGPNGSGKTTLLSLLSSDHPQAYSLPVKIFGQPRLPTPGKRGVSIFDIQSRIGHSSPEIHRFFPRHLTLRQTIRSAWADTFLGIPARSPHNDKVVDSALRWFEHEFRNPATPQRREEEDEEGSLRSTNWADTLHFRDLPFSAQRLALLLRALLKKPDLVILDEAFGGMDSALLCKSLLFLTWGTTTRFSDPHRRILLPQSFSERGGLITGLEQRQALIVVSHLRQEVPGTVRDWIRLPEPNQGQGPRFGRFKRPLEGCEASWREIWESRGYD